MATNILISEGIMMQPSYQQKSQNQEAQVRSWCNQNVQAICNFILACLGIVCATIVILKITSDGYKIKVTYQTEKGKVEVDLSPSGNGFIPTDARRV